MNDLEPIRPDNRSRYLMLTFHDTPTDVYELRAAEWSTARLSMRLTFEPGGQIEDQLAAPLLSPVRGIIARVKGQVGTVAMPDLVIQSENARLRACTAVMSTLRSGGSQITVTFLQVEGQATEFFCGAVLGQPAPEHIANSLRDAVLYSFYLPMLDLRGKIDQMRRRIRRRGTAGIAAGVAEISDDINRVHDSCETQLLPKLRSGHEI